MSEDSLIETAAIVISDLVGSTELASRVGPARADELRREHFEVLREAVAESGGVEIKNLGDGLMVAFKAASAAVKCAVAMQQLIDRRNRGADGQDGLHIRIGIGMGESTVEGGDYFGMPTVEAARLCSKAREDGILATELVRLMAARGDREVFKSVGALELKGIPEPVTAYEVTWEPVGAALSRVPLPAPMRTVPALAYVGREPERERLAALADEAAAGCRRVAFLAGEPGIGKTRLAGHTALDLHSQGATVLWGGAVADLGAPYGPWMQSLSHYVEHAPIEVLEEHMLRHGGEIGRLAHRLSGRIPDAPAPQRSDPETERYVLFAAVEDLLRAACSDGPVVLIFDDVHWADAQTLSLLNHVTRALEQAPFLVLATYRDTDLDRRHPLTAVLADLRRVGGVERISLTGLDPSNVAELMAAAAGHEMDSKGLSLAEEIGQETGGNPFFVAEVLQHLIESQAMTQRGDGRWILKGSIADLGLPQSVREVIDRRVESLGEDTAKILRVAAVIGREFDVDLLTAVTDQAEDEVLDALDRAVESSVLEESKYKVGSFRFLNALFSHTLYESIGATRRARVHRRVGEALEELCAGNPGSRVNELAVHWAKATATVDASKAVDYARQAGEVALAGLAPEEALRWFTQARDMLHETASDGSSAHCDVLTGLGVAQRQLGDPDFRETLLDASRIARDLGDDDRLARVALVNNRGFTTEIGEVDVERVEFLELLAERLSAEDPRRADVLGLLAMELVFHPDVQRRIGIAQEALSLARSAGDEEILTSVIERYLFALWLPDRLDERLRLGEELIERTDRSGDPLRRFMARQRHIYHLIEAGRLDEAQGCSAIERQISDAVPQPFFRWVTLSHAATLAHVQGQLAEADRLIEEAVVAGSEGGQPDAILLYVAAHIWLRRDQGRTDEILDLTAESVEAYPAIPTWRAVQAAALCDVGREDEAREALINADLDGIPQDFLTLTALSFWADACATLGLSARAEDLYRRLEPFRTQLVENGVAPTGIAAHFLGRLAACVGDHERAERDFDEAADICRRIGAPVLLARTEEAWGRLLLDSDPDRAKTLLESAVTRAQTAGAEGLVQHAEAALAGGPVRSS